MILRTIVCGAVLLCCSGVAMSAGGNVTGVGYSCDARDALDAAVNNGRSRCAREVANKGYKEFIYEGQRVLLGGDVQGIQGPSHNPTWYCSNGGEPGHGIGPNGRSHLTYVTVYCAER